MRTFVSTQVLMTILLVSAAKADSAVIYQTDFTGGLPAGWSIVDGDYDDYTWTSEGPGGRSNPNWTGTFMIVDSDSAGEVDMDEQLITHSIDCSRHTNITLKFKHYFERWTGEICDVDVRVSRGPWQNVARYQKPDASGLVELDLSSIAHRQPDVQIRWHYYNANYDGYWGIDDVEIRGAGASDDVPRYLSGYFKWLLHLGQNPTDRLIGHPAIHIDQLQDFGGDANIKPAPGDVYDFTGIWGRGNTNPMIWTHQYDADGFFADELLDGMQMYHIYVYSPAERQARFRYRHIGDFRVWNNGELVIQTKGWDSGVEQSGDFLLHEGANSITLKIAGSNWKRHLAVRITDRNNNEYTDLTYSLSRPLPSNDTYVLRDLPASYDAGGTIDVSVSLAVDSNNTPPSMTIVEYIPEDLAVADSGGGNVIGNTIQWSLAGEDVADANLAYSLTVPSEKNGTVAFCGYLYCGEYLEDIIGDEAVFETEPASAADMAGHIGTIEIKSDTYTIGENVGIERLYEREYGLVTGLRAGQTGGWAEYEFEVIHPGTYDIILDYAEYWTMFHHAADINVSIDGQHSFQAALFPTTHSYVYGHFMWATGWLGDPYSRAKWIVGSVDLNAGVHTLRLDFPAMYPAEMNLDLTTDGRPVIKKVILTNYPGFTVPNLVDPHHLDSYEHAPARIVHDRNITMLPDGRVEITFYSTFYSLSQGDEVYTVTGEVRPRVGKNDTKFEIVSMEPALFYVPPEGEQNFTLVVRSKEPIPEDYSELVMIWLQGAPSSPSRRLYFFSAALDYLTLPPYRELFPWSTKRLFHIVWSSSRYIEHDMTDPAEMFIPDKDDLGFDNGRYSRDMMQFFQDQFLAGNVPFVEQIFQDNGWDFENHSWRSWDQIWSQIFATLYWRDDNALPGRGRMTNRARAKEYVQRFAENLAFYPMRSRWDWSGPIRLPNIFSDVPGMAALAAHVRTAQENMISDDEQFKVLHNLVLPIFNSYYDAPRVYGVLSEDVHPGDRRLPLDRPPYGATGAPTDAFRKYRYVIVGDDLYMLYHSADHDGIDLFDPSPKFHPKGTRVIAWNFYEDIELEGRDMMSLIAIGAAGRDPALADEVVHALSEILEKQKVFLEDGSFRNEPGSYGGHIKDYPRGMLQVQWLFGKDPRGVVSQKVMDKLHNSMIYACEFPFSNGLVPHLNHGGAMNQLSRSYHASNRILEELFPEDQDNIALYKRIAQQEKDRLPGDIIDNHNFVIHGWGYAMLRSENRSWDRGMETLLSSKYLLSDGGDHVSHDGLGIVVYGLGAILTPRYGYSWIGYLPPFLNQVMVDESWENGYYGSFWHFDGRSELPSAVAHTGDGNDSSKLDFEMSRWCIQFPEYLFDAYFINANDGALHQYDWCFINMGQLEIQEPAGLSWSDYSSFLGDYWNVNRAGGPRTIASKTAGKIVADWRITNGPWDRDVHTDETLLRNPAQHSGRLRLIVADDNPSDLIKAEIGYYKASAGDTLANSQDIIVVRKNAVAHAFVDTLEPIADDEPAHVTDVTVIEIGNHQQQLVKVTTIEGQDWVYLSGQWGARPDGDQPVPGVTTDADIIVWRVVSNTVRRVYLAGGSYAITPNGSWDFGSAGNHYSADIDGDGVWDH